MKKKKSHSEHVVTGLLDYLSETGQTDILPHITEKLYDLSDESKKADSIVVTSVYPLTQEQNNSLKNILYKLTNISLPMKNNINKSILGGFIVDVGDWHLDVSLNFYLQNLKKLLA